jgi:signal transduction histidine kinase
MMPEHKLVENNQQLRKELDAALELIKRYEMMIADLQTEHFSTIKKTTHDLSNPLQILSMTIESLQDNSPVEMQPTIERMRRSAEVLTSIIITMRKLGTTKINPAKASLTI